MHESEKLELAIVSLKLISRVLDNIKYELEARVYTCDEDNFTDIFFCRDEADLTLRKIQDKE